MANADNGLPIALHLHTKITQENASEQFEFHEDGTLLKIGHAMYLRYTEHGQDGIDTPITFKLSQDGDIQLTRHTHNDVRLRFSPNAKMMTRYTTPAGSMVLAVHTTQMAAHYDDIPLVGNIAIDYTLYQGDLLLGDYELRLHFTEKN